MVGRDLLEDFSWFSRLTMTNFSSTNTNKLLIDINNKKYQNLRGYGSIIQQEFGDFVFV